MKTQAGIKILIVCMYLAAFLANGCEQEVFPDAKKESLAAQPETTRTEKSMKRRINAAIEQFKGKYAMNPGNPGKACFSPTDGFISEAILKTCARKGPGTPFGGDEAKSWLECRINNIDYYFFNSKKMCDIQREVVMANSP